MGWRDLLQQPGESIIAPWLGGRSLQTHDRTWRIDGRLPHEHGWYAFSVHGRQASLADRIAVEPSPGVLRAVAKGYLVGDRLVADDVRVSPNIASVVQSSEQVHLVEPGLDRFVRIAAGRAYEDGPLVYQGQEFPLGPEEQVLQAFLDGATSVDQVPCVAPALDASFRIEVWRRVEAEKRRREDEEKRRQEEERLAREQRRREIADKLGDGHGRREMAAVDFGEAARAALAVGGAQYLDHRRSPRRGEMVVRFRFEGRRFECVCSQQTLRIIDAGVCLTDHETGEKGDNRFTLESLPAVIGQALEEDKLVVFRHVN